MSLELGNFSFRYRSLAVHGFGISASSNFAVLYQASQLYLRRGAPLENEELAATALSFDRQAAGGLFVAADDVYPIVYGGVVKVLTQGRPRPDHVGVTVKPVIHSGNWIADHVLIACRPNGVRHNVANLLARLANHPQAPAIVGEISALAEQAADAIERENIQGLADCVIQYREKFDAWTERCHINSAVQSLVTMLRARFGDHILAWKPPGAGAAEAIAVIADNLVTRNSILDFLRTKTDWWCSPLYISSGVCGEFVTATPGQVRITAGHRLDFVGGADIGQDPRIGENGVCCSCAIEPRSEIIIEQADGTANYTVHGQMQMRGNSIGT